MTENILVCVAWPYANGSAHLGHIAGAYLPPDIFARYHRLRGSRVLMVSGSDSHGTPITLVADEEGVSARDIFLRYHDGFLHNFRDLGLSFDLFTHTDTENHHRVSQDIFKRLLEAKLLFRETEKQLFCEHDQRFLPDRYISGKCPNCGFPSARGDQCQNCDHVHDALELGDPQCKLKKPSDPPHKLSVRKTEHFYFDLPALEQTVLAWFDQEAQDWRPNVVNFARNYVKDGLVARAITRDIDWGVAVPIEGWESKRLYAWFEAVIGYLSAAIEWARNSGQPEAWKDFWYPPARTYYFIGKDNIPFHAILWPAMLIGAGDVYDSHRHLLLPYDIPANEFITLEGRKFSKSDKWAVWLPDALSRYDPDPLRYYLTAIAPETHDSDWNWDDFLRRNNDELVATWGNLANRVLTFAWHNFERQVPPHDNLGESDRAILSKVESAFAPIGSLIARCQFRAALFDTMALAREANRYLDEQAPWISLRADRARAAHSVYVALRVIDSLKVLLTPFLPFSSQLLHEQLGYDDSLSGSFDIKEFAEAQFTHRALCFTDGGSGNRWRPSELKSGQPLREPKPLYKKLDAKIVEEERSRLGR